MEISWEKVLNLRISKKLAEVCNQWGFNIRYLNSSFQAVHVATRQENTLCHWIEHHPKAKVLCDQWLHAQGQQAREGRKSSMDICPAGLLAIIVPMMDQDGC